MSGQGAAICSCQGLVPDAGSGIVHVPLPECHQAGCYRVQVVAGVAVWQGMQVGVEAGLEVWGMYSILGFGLSFFGAWSCVVVRGLSVPALHVGLKSLWRLNGVGCVCCFDEFVTGAMNGVG